jgi:hypothetical protein
VGEGDANVVHDVHALALLRVPDPDPQRSVARECR